MSNHADQSVMVSFNFGGLSIGQFKLPADAHAAYLPPGASASFNYDYLTSKLATCESFVSSCADSSVPSSLAVLKMLPKQYVLSDGKHLSNSTVFGIRDTSHIGLKDWVIRADRAHKGANFEHLNVNPALAQIPSDPHYRLPSGVVPVLGAVTKVVNVVGDVACYASAAADTYKIGKAAVQDFSATGALGERTASAVVHVGARYAGGYAGAVVGGKAGATIGSMAGTLCFGMTVPGAAIGSLAGSLYGAIAGGYGASCMAQEATANEEFKRYFSTDEA